MVIPSRVSNPTRLGKEMDRQMRSVLAATEVLHSTRPDQQLLSKVVIAFLSHLCTFAPLAHRRRFTLRNVDRDVRDGSLGKKLN